MYYQYFKETSPVLGCSSEYFFDVCGQFFDSKKMVSEQC